MEDQQVWKFKRNTLTSIFWKCLQSTVLKELSCHGNNGPERWQVFRQHQKISESDFVTQWAVMSRGTFSNSMSSSAISSFESLASIKNLKGAYRRAGERCQFTRACSDRSRGNVLKLKENRFRLHIRKNSITVKVVRHWERLPRKLCMPSPQKQYMPGCMELRAALI